MIEYFSSSPWTYALPSGIYTIAARPEAFQGTDREASVIAAICLEIDD